MDDHTRRNLEEAIDRIGDDEMTPEDLKPALDEKLELVEERLTEDRSKEDKVDIAAGMLSGEAIRDARTGLNGDPTDLKILAIGHRGVFEDWGQDDPVDTVMSHAIIRGPIGEDGKVRSAKAILFNKKSHLDLLEVQQKFSPMNELQANYEVESAWSDLSDQGFFRAYSHDDTKLVETDIDDLPDTRDEKNEMLRSAFPDVELAELGRDGSYKGFSSFDAETDANYTDDWGADIKRFEGKIVDYYIKDDRTYGRYTVSDESMVAEEVEGSRLMDSQDNVPGLTVHCQPDYHMNQGRMARVDVYGVIQLDDGKPEMNAVGVVPIMEMPLDEDDQADSDVEATETSL
jgi:hypothetical protein